MLGRRQVCHLASAYAFSYQSSTLGSTFWKHYNDFHTRLEQADQRNIGVGYLEQAYSKISEERAIADKAYQAQVEDAFIARAPVKGVLDAYTQLKNVRVPNQGLIANSIYNLGRVVSARRSYDAAYWDLADARLTDHPAYQVLLHDLKVLLLQTPVMDLESMYRICRGLRLIEFKDPELLRLLLQRFDVIMNPQSKYTFKPQSFKQYLQVVSYFIKDAHLAQQSITREDLDGDERQIYELVQDIRESLKNERIKVMKLFEGIRHINESYHKMLKVQDQAFVTQNVNLNYQMLELEEFFVNEGFISIQEVRNPSEGFQLQSILQKTVDYISQGDSNVMQLINHLFMKYAEPRKQERAPENLLAYHPLELATALSEYADLVSESSSSDELIPQEWSKQFQERKLIYDRAFSRLFMEAQQSFAQFYTYIQPSLQHMQPIHLYDLGLSWSRIGHFQLSRQIVSQVKSVPTEPSLSRMALLEQAMLVGQKLPDDTLAHCARDLDHFILDDEQFTTSVLALVVQHYLFGANVPDLQGILQDVSGRFSTVYSVDQLSMKTVENLQDLYAFTRVTLPDSPLFNLNKANAKWTLTDPAKLNPYILHLKNLFSKTSSYQQFLSALPPNFQPQIYRKAGQKVLAVLVVPYNYVDVSGNVDGRVLFRQRLTQAFADQNNFKLEVRVLPITALLRHRNGNWDVVSKEEFKANTEQVLELSQSNVQLLDYSSIPFDESLLAAKVKYHLDKAKYFNRCLQKSVTDGSISSNTAQLRLHLLHAQELVKHCSKEIQDSYNALNITIPDLPKTDNSNNTGNSWFGAIQTQFAGNVKDTVEGFCASLLRENYNTPSEMSQQLQSAGLLGRSMYQQQTLTTPLAQLVLYPHLRTDPAEVNFVVRLLPNPSKQRQQLQPPFRVDWRQLFGTTNDTELEAFLEQDQQVQDVALEEDWFKLNLHNFVEELKTKDPVQLTREILELKLWDQVLSEKVRQSQSNTETRHIFRDFREFLKTKPSPNSPSLTFLSRKVRERAFMRELLRNKNALVRRMQLDIANHKITLKGYRNVREQIDNLIENALKQYKVRHSSSHASLQGRQYKFLDVRVTQEHIDKLRLVQGDNHNLADWDFILNENDMDRFILLQRSRAEDKVLLYRILYRIQRGEQPTADEKAFLNQLRQHNQFYDHQPSTSNIPIEQVQDKEYLNSMCKSRLTAYGKFSVHEVALELSRLFRDDLYWELMQRFTYGIESQPTPSQLHVVAEEQRMWAQKSRLTQHELEHLADIINVPARHKDPNVRNTLNRLNQINYPQALIRTWVQAYQNEVTKEYSSHILDENHQNNRLWEEVFGVPYDQTLPTQISDFVEEFVRRMMLIKHHQPFFTRRLLKMLLQHKNLSQVDRNVLATYLELFKPNIEFSAKDIEDIAQSAYIQQHHQETAQEHLKHSAYPYLNKLWPKLLM